MTKPEMTHESKDDDCVQVKSRQMDKKDKKDTTEDGVSINDTTTTLSCARTDTNNSATDSSQQQVPRGRMQRASSSLINLNRSVRKLNHFNEKPSSIPSAKSSDTTTITTTTRKAWPPHLYGNKNLRRRSAANVSVLDRYILSKPRAESLAAATARKNKRQGRIFTKKHVHKATDRVDRLISENNDLYSADTAMRHIRKVGAECFKNTALRSHPKIEQSGVLGVPQEGRACSGIPNERERLDCTKRVLNTYRTIFADPNPLPPTTTKPVSISKLLGVSDSEIKELSLKSITDLQSYKQSLTGILSKHTSFEDSREMVAHARSMRANKSAQILPKLKSSHSHTAKSTEHLANVVSSLSRLKREQSQQHVSQSISTTKNESTFKVQVFEMPENGVHTKDQSFDNLNPWLIPCEKPTTIKGSRKSYVQKLNGEVAGFGIIPDEFEATNCACDPCGGTIMITTGDRDSEACPIGLAIRWKSPCETVHNIGADFTSQLREQRSKDSSTLWTNARLAVPVTRRRNVIYAQPKTGWTERKSQSVQYPCNGKNSEDIQSLISFVLAAATRTALPPIKASEQAMRNASLVDVMNNRRLTNGASKKKLTFDNNFASCYVCSR